MNTTSIDRIEKCRQNLGRLKKEYDESAKKTLYGRTKVVNGLKVSISYHPYKLNACLDEKALQVLEGVAETKFPEEFRECLLQLGNGGGLFWDELDPEKPAVHEHYLIGRYAMLDSEWPYDTILLLSGQKANHIYEICTEGEDEPSLLKNSFLDWVEEKIEKELKSPSAYDRTLGKTKKQKPATGKDSGTHKKSNDIRSLQKKLCDFHQYDLHHQAEILAGVREAIAGNKLTADQYFSLLDAAFIRHLDDIQSALGENALDRYRRKEIKLSRLQLGEVLEYTGLAYMNIGDERAISLLEECLALKEDNFHYANIAKTFWKLHRLEEASKFIEKAPRTFYTLHIRGMIYFELGQRDEAEKSFIAGIKNYETDPVNYEALGDLYCYDGKHEQAVEQYLFAINRCHYVSREVYFKLARLYTRVNKITECLAVISAVLEAGDRSILARMEADQDFAKLITLPQFIKIKNGSE